MSKASNNREITRPQVNIKDLEEIVGAGNVSDMSSLLDEYSRDLSFAQACPPSFIVKPGNNGEVAELIKWANRTLVPLIPVSSGPPRFRGDTVPVMGGVIVDLSRMNRVLRVDRRNRVAMIEPGVTFGALQSEIDAQGMRVSMPLAPRKTKSIVGSYLEREPILIPRHHWDMSDPLCCLEVIFGTGDLFMTGAAAGPGTIEQQRSVGQAQKNPLGPGQSDLFRVVQGSQGGIGIVTWATVRLELKPSIQELFMVGCEKIEEVIELVYRMQRLKLGEECLILNRLNLASILNSDSEAIKDLGDKLPPWTLIFVVAGYERLPGARLLYQKKDILDIARGMGLSANDKMDHVDSDKLLKAIQSISSDPYWKLRNKGNSADIFFLTTLDRSPDFVKIMGEVANTTGFPANNIGGYIQPIQQGRSVHMEFNLHFDPKAPAETEMARETFNRASVAFKDRGAFFSRPYGTWWNMVKNKYAENVIALRKVKNIFDPNNILNPGRLFD